MMTEKSGMIVSGSGWVPLSFYREGGRGLRVLITLTQNAQLSRNKKIIRALTGKSTKLRLKSEIPDSPK